MLMDATVATGAAAMMAVRVLLDHDVPEENILLLSLLMAESGILHRTRIFIYSVKLSGPCLLFVFSNRCLSSCWII